MVTALVNLSKKDFATAISDGERALALGPDMANVATLVGVVFYCSGRFDEGHALIERAIRLCPVCPGYYYALLGQTLNLLERYDEAIDAYQKGAALEPDYPTPHFGMALAHASLGRVEQARAAAERFRKVSPQLPSLREYAKRHPFKEQAVVEGWAATLKSAGID